MPRSRRNEQKAKEPSNDLSFPVPYAQQAKYLKLADDFLASDLAENVIPINRDKKEAGKKEKKEKKVV